MGGVEEEQRKFWEYAKKKYVGLGWRGGNSYSSTKPKIGGNFGRGEIRQSPAKCSI